jgi:hypothetical protein
MNLYCILLQKGRCFAAGRDMRNARGKRFGSDDNPESLSESHLNGFSFPDTVSILS